MSLFTLHRACATIVTHSPVNPDGVLPTHVETVCGDGDMIENARRDFQHLTNGMCSTPPKDVKVACLYWEEDTFLLWTLRKFADVAQWLGE